MTFSERQGHKVTLEIWKKTDFRLSDTDNTTTTVESLPCILANCKTFTTTYNMITLALVQGHWGHWMTLKM